jgi:hypothetical protein
MLIPLLILVLLFLQAFIYYYGPLSFSLTSLCLLEPSIWLYAQMNLFLDISYMYITFPLKF